jgi:hypothetical protein
VDAGRAPWPRPLRYRHVAPHCRASGLAGQAGQRQPAPASASQRQPSANGQDGASSSACAVPRRRTVLTVQYSTVGSLQAAKHGARPKRRGAAAGHNHGHGHGHGHDEVQVDPDGAHHVAKRSAAGVDRPRSQRSAAQRSATTSLAVGLS